MCAPFTNFRNRFAATRFDRDGNVTQEDYPLAIVIPAAHSDFDQAFTYSQLGQLTATAYFNGSAHNQTFTVNALGDMSGITTGGITQNRTTNSENQITAIGSATISYDNNGNVTTDDKGNTLVYDAWNRLVEVKNSSGDLVAGYTYDGLGRMTSETNGISTIDFYYSGEQIIEERTGVTNATGGSTGSNGTVTEEFVYSPDYVNDVLSRDTYVSGSYSSRVFFTHDANYDVTGVVQNSTTGTMLQRMTYDSYGNVTFLTSSWTTTTDSFGVENLWQGGWRDVNTGYYHFQERWYSPSMQWLSWDPANYPDGPSAYLPIADNPIDGDDPSGMYDFSDMYTDDTITMVPMTTYDNNGNATGTTTHVQIGDADDDGPAADEKSESFDFASIISKIIPNEGSVTKSVRLFYFQSVDPPGYVEGDAEISGTVVACKCKEAGKAGTMFEGVAKISIEGGFGGEIGKSGVPALAQNKGDMPEFKLAAGDPEPCADTSLGGDWKLELVAKGSVNAVVAGGNLSVPIGEVTKDGAKFTFDPDKLKGELTTGGGLGVKLGVEASAEAKIFVRLK